MPLNCSTFVTQKEQLKCQAARVNAIGVRQSIKNVVDACNGFKIRITVTLEKYSKK